MSNKVYTIKFAESHLNLVLGLLGKQPYEQVSSIVNSIGNQIQQQPKAEAVPYPPSQIANGHDTDAHA
jgi:hypothetical protein